MNNSLRQFLLKTEGLLSILYFFKRLTYEKAFLKDINLRAKADLFNLEALSANLKQCPFDYSPENNMYGIIPTLKNYAGIKLSKKCNGMIEHGLHFGDFVSPDLKYYPQKTYVITFSDFRKEKLLKSGCKRKVYKIGSYIQYAHSLLNETEKEIIKEKYGRILLVIPNHSTVGTTCNFSMDSFIEEINIRKKDYNSVFVCLYFVDAQNKQLVSRYKDEGYKIVTAGHKFDLNFLNRLRTIIELSDFTMSNDVGTHVGYAISLNKPHYIFKQQYDITYENKAVKKKYAHDIELVNSSAWKLEVNEVASYFNQYSLTINDKQKEIVRKYWGNLEPLSKEDIKKILNS